MIRMALIFGGASPEHEVSLASARSVLDHLESSQIVPVPIGITKSGDWLVGPGAWAELIRHADPTLLPAALSRELGSVPPAHGDFIRFPRLPQLAAFDEVDLIFPVVHGRSGEDGMLQAFCQATKLPFVGCDLLSSALCFDKVITRTVLESAGLPIARGISFTRRQVADNIESVYREIYSYFEHYDLFSKPARSGSSLGIARIRGVDDIPAAFETAFRYDERVLIEEYVPHRELVIGVLGNDDLVISPPGECVSTQELYSYQEKYILGNPYFRCPAPIPAEVAAEACLLAKRAYKALRCSGFARVDCFLNRLSGQLTVNEVNTIPGLTTSSVYPKVMREAGYSYDSVLKELVRLAMESHRSAVVAPSHPTAFASSRC